jgi:hypothetical protein
MEEKKLIISSYNTFVSLKNNNEIVKEYIETMDNLSKQIVQNIEYCKKLDVIDVELNDKINNLNLTFNNLKEEYDKLIQKELHELYTKYPVIYEKIVTDNIPIDVLLNVLDTFISFKSGNINKENAVKKGMEFSERKYKLPKNFFDRSKAKDYE